MLPAVTWMLRVLLTILLLGAGYKKLVDARAMALLFDQIVLGK
jgi:hypothetical protein